MNETREPFEPSGVQMLPMDNGMWRLGIKKLITHPARTQSEWEGFGVVFPTPRERELLSDSAAEIDRLTAERDEARGHVAELLNERFGSE